MNSLRLYVHYLSINLRSQLEYRAATYFLILGQLTVSFGYFIGVFLLFSYFGNLLDWSFWEVMLCAGAVQTAFPLAECFARGFDSFSSLIRTGSFDTLLLRPRGIVLQVFGSRF